MQTNYAKSFEQLEASASKFWPQELIEIESSLSVIPLLLRTQDDFIDIISVQVPNIESLFTVLEASSFPANLFLKHLVILADFGGEMLQRVSAEFHNIFPNGELNYLWNGNQQKYVFQNNPPTFSNKALKIDGKELFNKHKLDSTQKDAIALLLFGSVYSCENTEFTAALSKCEIGEYLGKRTELTSFIKQRYIWVSRITSGATSNNLGQIAQNFVAQFITDNLHVDGANIQNGGRLPNVTQTDAITGRMTSFDLVVSKGKKYVAIEVGFQVTTNSVIERKSGQAQSRFIQAEKAGHKIAYVLDGAGNFQRETALRNICAYSHCTVAFSKKELEVLCQFLREQF